VINQLITIYGNSFKEKGKREKERERKEERAGFLLTGCDARFKITQCDYCRAAKRGGKRRKERKRRKKKKRRKRERTTDREASLASFFLGFEAIRPG